MHALHTRFCALIEWTSSNNHICFSLHGSHKITIVIAMAGSVTKNAILQNLFMLPLILFFFLLFTRFPFSYEMVFFSHLVLPLSLGEALPFTGLFCPAGQSPTHVTRFFYTFRRKRHAYRNQRHGLKMDYKTSRNLYFYIFYLTFLFYLLTVWLWVWPHLKVLSSIVELTHAFVSGEN